MRPVSSFLAGPALAMLLNAASGSLGVVLLALNLGFISGMVVAVASGAADRWLDTLLGI